MIIEVKDLRNLKSYGDLNVDVKLFLIIIFNRAIKMEKERIKKYYPVAIRWLPMIGQVRYD